MYAGDRNQLRLPISKLDHYMLLATTTDSRNNSTHEMAVVVRVSTIITQKTHRVLLGNVLRMILEESLCSIPQGRNSLHILVQTQHETVLLLVVGHKLEWIIVDVAEKLNAWLDSPIPLVVHHQWLSEEES